MCECFCHDFILRCKACSGQPCQDWQRSWPAWWPGAKTVNCGYVDNFGQNVDNFSGKGSGSTKDLPKKLASYFKITKIVLR